MPEQTSSKRNWIGFVRLDEVSDAQLAAFDCGKLALNLWLINRARANDSCGGSRTYVLVANDGRIAGFFCLSNYSFAHDLVRVAVRRNMPDPIPATLLGRLAVDLRFQGKGVGRSLLRYAIDLSVRASKITNSALLATQPIDEEAEHFYRHFGFVPVKQGMPMLMILLKNF